MTTPTPSSTADWREFLRRYSAEFLESPYLRDMEAEGSDEFFVSKTQRKNRWLGYEPATEEAIAAAEEKLGVRLPPSYRNFLLVSNGFSMISYSSSLLEVDEVGWSSELRSDLLDAWSDLDHFTDELEVLKRCVLISSDDDGCANYLLLHADAVADNSEWAAYQWLPGEGFDPRPFEYFPTLVTDL